MMVSNELGGAPLGVAYEKATLSEPATGKGIPIGALVKRQTDGTYALITNADTDPILVAGVIANTKDIGGGSFDCDIMVIGVWSGVVYEYDSVGGNWLATTRYAGGILQNPIHIK